MCIRDSLSLSDGANDVAVALEETDATFIEVRLVDATGNKQPIEDLRVSLAMKIYPQGGEDDVDNLLNVARTVELRLENELGRAAREAKTEGERAAQVEYDRARAAVTAQRQAVFFRRPISAFWTCSCDQGSFRVLHFDFRWVLYPSTHRSSDPTGRASESEGYVRAGVHLSLIHI